MLKDVKETAAWERSKGEFSVIEVPAVIVSIETFVSLQKERTKISLKQSRTFMLNWDGANSAWKNLAIMSLLSGLRIHLLQEDMGIQKFLSAIS